MERNPLAERLDLDDGCRITLRLEPLLGWSRDDAESAPHPLTLPASLLRAAPSSAIVYSCNLPAQARAAPLDFCGQLPAAIGRDLEGEFLAVSLPGGQAAIHAADGERLAVQFRWICLTAHASIGAVWRCFVRLRARASGGPWRAVEHDYLFEAGGRAALNAPSAVRAPLGPALNVRLVHPEGRLTCFPCQAGLVKVTRLEADGWAKRSLLSLSLYADNRVVALFSDGARRTVATAAPAFQRGSRAA